MPGAKPGDDIHRLQRPDSTADRGWGKVVGMWKVLERSKWIRRFVLLEGVGSFGEWVWAALASLLGKLVGGSALMGAIFAAIDGSGLVGIGVAAFGFALMATLLL